MSVFFQIGLVCLVIFGVVKCQSSDYWQEHERLRAAREKVDQTPRVIREADGCKVYTFKSDSKWHFFTRCGDTVTTERRYSESCGKNRTCERSEVIVTEGNK